MLLYDISSAACRPGANSRSDPIIVDSARDTFDYILHDIYPNLTSPTLTDLELAITVLYAADKYDMQGVIGRVATELMLSRSHPDGTAFQLLDSTPLRVHAVATKLNLETLKTAALDSIFLL